MGQNHFRQRPLTVELIKELNMQRAEAVYADRFADLGDATFVFVGAFDWDNLRSLTASYLAALPTTGRAEQWRDVEIDPPMTLIDEVVRAGTEPRSNTIVVFAGDMEWSPDEALALNVAGEVLGKRLHEQVREALGASYGVFVNARSSRLPDQEYLGIKSSSAAIPPAPKNCLEKCLTKSIGYKRGASRNTSTRLRNSFVRPVRNSCGKTVSGSVRSRPLRSTVILSGIPPAWMKG